MQTFNGTTINSGASIVATSNGNDTIVLGAITRSVGGTVDFTGFGNATSGNITTTNTSNTNGIMGGSSTWGNVTTWAVAPASSGGAITGLASASYTTSVTAGNTAISYANKNIDVTSSQTPGAAITPYTLRFNAAAAETLTLQGTNVVGGGGILVTNTVAAHASTVTGGTLEGA